MPNLRRPRTTGPIVQQITPENAGWTYCGLTILVLEPGATHSDKCPIARETLLVVLEGTAEITADGHNFGRLGRRRSLFEHTPPFALYMPPACPITVTAAKDTCTIALASAPCHENHPLHLIAPEDIQVESRGQGSNQRRIHPIFMSEKDRAQHLLVTEVYTPQGHCSSYPPHRHDEDDPPRITQLEEIYYHRITPAQGFAFQRIYTDDLSLDETYTLHDGDVVLVPKGYHPCAALYGYDLYYLNVMAGPKRAWNFLNHPDHEWLITKT